MKKIDKSSLVIILTGFSLICLMIGGYMVYSGIGIRQNFELVISELEKAKQTNKGLQENLKTMKELVAAKPEAEENQPMDTDEGIIARNTEIDPITGTYVGEKYPPNLDVTSINYLEAYGVNAQTVLYAYKDMLKKEGYPDELDGEHGLIQQVELIDAHTCIVTLSTGTEDLKIIYALDYGLGIEFTEVKKDMRTRLNNDPSYFESSLQDEYLTITSRYDVETMELIDSQLTLRHNIVSYSPDGRYRTSINYDPRSYFTSMDYAREDHGPSLSVIDTYSDELLYKNEIRFLRDIDIKWFADSSRFIIGNYIYSDMDNMKVDYLLDVGNDTFSLISSSITKDYIVKFGIEHIEDGLNQFICKIYDLDNTYISEFVILETSSEVDDSIHTDTYCFANVIYDNAIELDYYDDTNSKRYFFDLSEEEVIVINRNNQNQIYTYVPELGWRIKEISGPSGEDIILVFEDLDGNELYRKDYEHFILSGYLGVNVEAKEMYFSWNNYDFLEEDTKDIIAGNIITYNYEENLFALTELPTDHLVSRNSEYGIFNWPLNYKQGILEIYTIIPLDSPL